MRVSNSNKPFPSFTHQIKGGDLFPIHKDKAMAFSHSPKWNLLVLSDLHLGEQMPGESRESVELRSRQIDNRFSSFLSYFTQHKKNNLPWRLIIAGDLLDFMRTHVFLPESPEVTPDDVSAWKIPPHDLEGSLLKLDQIFRLHKLAFIALSQFINDGNELVLISGNHDSELNWPELQEAFRSNLYDIASQFAPNIDRETFYQRIKFSPWFYYEVGRIYVEHGHLYDPYNVIDDFLNPGATHPQKEVLSPSHIVSKGQNPCQEALSKISLEHLDSWDFNALVDWFLLLNWQLRKKVFLQISSLALQLLVTAWNRQFRKTLTMDPKEQEKAFQKISEEQKIELDILRKLKDFSTPPIYDKFFDTLQALYIDRLILLLLTTMIMTFALLVPWNPTIRALIMTMTATLTVYLYTFLARRRPVSESIPGLIYASLQIATLLQVPFVVFGHVHQFQHKKLDDDKTYINIGTWCETALPADKPSLEELKRHPRDKRGDNLIALSNLCEGEELSDIHNPYLVLTYDGRRHHVEIGCWHNSQESSFQYIKQTLSPFNVRLLENLKATSK